MPRTSTLTLAAALALVAGTMATPSTFADQGSNEKAVKKATRQLDRISKKNDSAERRAERQAKRDARNAERRLNRAAKRLAREEAKGDTLESPISQDRIEVAGGMVQGHFIPFTEEAGKREFAGRIVVRPCQERFGATNPKKGERATDPALGLHRVVHAATDRARARLVDEAVAHYGDTDEYVVEIPEGADINDILKDLLETGDYEHAEPDWMEFPTGTVPNDPQFGSSWQHDALESRAAWDINTGIDSPIVVAVVDVGVDTAHPDLVDNIVPGYNTVNELGTDEGGDVSDTIGHGTFVAGLVGARGNNGSHVTGVGWGIKIMPVKVTNFSHGGAFSSEINQGARWAAENGAQVINVSFSGGTSRSVGDTAEYCKSLGALYFRGAGNAGGNMTAEDHPDVILVGATTPNDTRWPSSNYGMPMDLVAPGNGVRSTTRNGGHAADSGTSFASPIAAGVAAMIWTVNPELTPDEVKDILFTTVDDLGTPGRDAEFGYGRVNLRAAMEAAAATVEPEPCVADFNDDGSVDLGDFSSLMVFFGLSSARSLGAENLDLTGDDVVDYDDFSIFASEFGREDCPSVPK